MICPECKKVYKKEPHYRNCSNEKSKEDFKLKCIYYNFDELVKNDGEFLKQLYLKQKLSVYEIKNSYNISTGNLNFLLDSLGIQRRNLLEANAMIERQNKYKKTCIAKYGTTNALSRGTSPYEKRNNTVKQKYDVDNVFQLEQVKDKLNETMIKLYGQKRITNIGKALETKAAWTDEYKKEIGNKIKTYRLNLTDEQAYNIELKRRKTISEKYKKDFYAINKLESKISHVLTELNIPHEFSIFVGTKQFDFKIAENLLVEVQGDYWHANPVMYDENDFVYKKTAKEIWDKDEKKRLFAESRGYKVIYIWENEIKKLSNEEIAELLETKISSLLHRQ